MNTPVDRRVFDAILGMNLPVDLIDVHTERETLHSREVVWAKFRGPTGVFTVDHLTAHDSTAESIAAALVALT